MTDDLIGEFCAFYHPYHAISPERRRIQTYTLREFERHVGKPFAELEAADLSDFLAARLETRMASTVTAEMSMVKPFVKWLWQRKHITADQFLEIKEVTPPRGGRQRQPRPYDRKEIQALWKALDDSYALSSKVTLDRFRAGTAGFARVRGHSRRLQYEAVICLALYGGLRCGEIYKLRLEDMDPDNDYLVVRGARKNRQAEEVVRVVPMPAPMRDALRAWLDWRAELMAMHPEESHDRPWLCLHSRTYVANKLRWRAYVDLMRNLGRMPGGPPTWEFHRLRHTFGTEMIRAHMPVETLQKIMGHASIQQTMEYVKLATDDIVNHGARAEAQFVRNLERARAA